MAKTYRVTLSGEEREELSALLRKGKAQARQRAPARGRAPVDESASRSGNPEEQTAPARPRRTRPLERRRARFVEQALAAALLPRRVPVASSGPARARQRRDD